MQIVVLTGAGVSAESGLGTFRDQEGLWTRYDLNVVATPEGFASNPEQVWEFYGARRRNLLDAKPNAAHFALGRLQRALGARLTLVTQNIDDLHEQGGATDVVHMHGELLQSLCAACDHRFPDRESFGPDRACPACGQSGCLRPDVVWFGEMPYQLDRIYSALDKASLFVAIGTSGAVYPAAGFVQMAMAQGIETMELNLEPSDNARLFKQRRYGPASEVIPVWVEEVLRTGAFGLDV